LGSVSYLWLNPAVRLSAYARRHPHSGIPNEPRYQARLAKARDKLKKRMGPYWERTKEGVSELLDYARERGVRLGIENREKLDELPLDDDLVDYFSGLPEGASAGYWHDTGHADIKESMGLISQRAQLSSLASRTIGFHLHDVNAAGQDHQAVGSGHVDFKMISSFWRPEHVFVIELSPRGSVQGVRDSLEKLQSLKSTP
jgi:sugar phosphate isomerase/epimerase